MKLTFLGAVDTVTGSKYLLESRGLKVLIDCGLYQGLKKLRLRNWSGLPFDACELDAVFLTHAHIDHTGYLPVLMKSGFRGPIFCTQATQALSEVLLPDAGFLQEEEARFVNKHKCSKHHPAQPLYTEAEARQVLNQFRIRRERELNTFAHLKYKFTPVGHILGAAAIQFDDGEQSIVFSGDVGRSEDILMPDPEPFHHADTLVVESTYGNRLHEKRNAMKQLESIVNRTIERGGIVLIPSFAVGRAQVLLYLLLQLRRQNLIPLVPIYLNSPMAISATDIYRKLNHLHKLSLADCQDIDAMTRYVRTPEASIELNQKREPSIIISASGMASGGRVLHHMKGLIGNEKNSIVFAGYQAPGTRGQALVDGADSVKIHGEVYKVLSEVHNLDSLSAHGDYQDILDWIDRMHCPPKRVFVTHGEALAADALRLKIIDRFNSDTQVPELNVKYTL
jgi:metallo-beta-lactamase family protein